MTIPKIIHYCWFGKGDKPQDVIEYINGWSRMLPEYEIVEWNESNFDIAINDYVKEAYDAKKYAFVSDYARLFALYHQGGIYLDTDVEVFKVFDDLLENDVVLGFEEKNFIATSTICARKNSSFIHEFMCIYHDKHFLLSNGESDLTTNVTKITTLLEKYGLVLDGNEQKVTTTKHEVIRVLDRIKFSPYDYLTQANYTDKSTYAVHHFGATWASSSFKLKKVIKSLIIKILGSNNYKKLMG
jgi:hypothetical protein